MDARRQRDAPLAVLLCTTFLLLIPTYFPLHFYHLSAYARIHFVPMMIALNKRYTSHEKFPSLAHLDANMTKNPFDWFMAREERSTHHFLTYMRSYTALDSRLDFSDMKQQSDICLTASKKMAHYTAI